VLFVCHPREGGDPGSWNFLLHQSELIKLYIIYFYNFCSFLYFIKLSGNWIPVGVYPREDGGGNDIPWVIDYQKSLACLPDHPEAPKGFRR